MSYGSYTVDELITYAKNKPVITIDLNELKHQYPHDRISKKRLEKVVIEGFPIIVKRHANGELSTLDGFHRAYKAIKEGRTTIEGVLLTDKDLEILKRASKRHVSMASLSSSSGLTLYHYSKDFYPNLLTRRKSGKADAAEIKRAEESAKRLGLEGPYVDHISFFFDPIPADILPGLYGPDHAAWFKGNKLYEYVVDVDSLQRDLLYRVVESERKTAFMDKFVKDHNWVEDDPVLLMKYLKEIDALQRKWGELGRDWPEFKKQILQNQGKTRAAFIRASQREDFQEGRQRYATNVPHLMVYPTPGVIDYAEVNTVTLGSDRRIPYKLRTNNSFTKW